jgi:hypothetical protein
VTTAKTLDTATDRSSSTSILSTVAVGYQLAVFHYNSVSIQSTLFDLDTINRFSYIITPFTLFLLNEYITIPFNTLHDIKRQDIN